MDLRWIDPVPGDEVLMHRDLRTGQPLLRRHGSLREGPGVT